MLASYTHFNCICCGGFFRADQGSTTKCLFTNSETGQQNLYSIMLCQDCLHTAEDLTKEE